MLTLTPQMDRQYREDLNTASGEQILLARLLQRAAFFGEKEFPKDFIGIDSLLEAEIEAIRLGSGSISIDEVVKYYHPDWSQEEINSEVKKINENNKQAKKPISQSSDKKENQQK